MTDDRQPLRRAQQDELRDVSSTVVDDAQWLDNDEKHAWRALLQMSGRVLSKIDAQLRCDGDITLGDYEILVCLRDETDCRLRIGDLAERLLYSTSRLTYRIDLLVKRDLVERQPSDEDGRVTYAVLTRSGCDILDALAPLHLDEVRRVVFDHLTPEQVTNFRNALEAVTGAND